jgi:hypothetical protein
MRSAFLLPFILLISLKLFSQPVINSDTTYYIKGKVFVDDFGVLEPLECVCVGIIDTELGGITDTAGNFQIDGIKSGTYKISVTYIGYAKTDTSIKISDESITGLIFTLNTYCIKYDSEKAGEDIKNKTPKLFLFGSIAPVYYPGQENFENKYGVEYYELGDNLEESLECNESYNKIIFKYLDEKFGGEWRKEVRKDVLGFTKK